MKKDVIVKNYMRNRRIFADVFNYLIFNGEQVVDPKNLRELDPTTLALPPGKDGRPVPVQKIRDLFKHATIMRDGVATYLLLGIENQSQIHETMPVRIMVYDALGYAQQIEDIRKARLANGEKFDSSSEFLSGFRRTDRILPIITVTLYLGSDEWTAARSLHDMFGPIDERIKKFVPDYNPNLIVPAEMTEEDLAKLHSELGFVLNCLKYAGDKKKVESIFRDKANDAISRETIDVLNTLTDSKLRYAEGEERVNMSFALDEIIADAKAEAKAEGVLEILVKLVKNGTLTLAAAAENAGTTVEEFIAKTGLTA